MIRQITVCVPCNVAHGLPRRSDDGLLGSGTADISHARLHLTSSAAYAFRVESKMCTRIPSESIETPDYARQSRMGPCC
jgi:hypothetical protein